MDRKKQKIKGRGTGSWVALFDLRKAYDSVSHKILLDKLKKLMGNHVDDFTLIAHLLQSA